MNILEAEKMINGYMAQYISDWTFQWDRATSRFGRCRHNLKRITMSKALSELNDIEEVKDTILHEIAHALVGNRNGHNYIWKIKCLEIGARPERTYDSKITTPKGKYQAVCHGCSRVINRMRMPKCKMSCGICSGSCFNPNYILEFKETK